MSKRKHTCAPGIEVPRILSCSPGPTAYKYSWLVMLSAFSHGKPLLLDMYSPVHNPSCPHSSDLTREAPVTPVERVNNALQPNEPDQAGTGQQQPTTGLGFTCGPHLSWTLLCLLEPRLPVLAQGTYFSKDWRQSGNLGLPWFS